MKFILTVAGSRAGMEFFLSLLDGHTQILQFPGILRGNKRLKEILSFQNPNKVSHNFLLTYKHFFDSRDYNLGDSASLDRHNQLGENKRKYYKVNKKKFKNYFKLLSKKKFFQEIQINNLVNLHKAYALSLGKKLKKKKILIINSHLIDYLKFYNSNIFNNIDFEIIHTIRHPLSALSSPLKWLKFDNGKEFTPRSIYFHLDLVINGIMNLKNFKKKIILIKLEDLHLKNEYILKKFCNEVGINYEKIMKKSTFNGLKWWGDKISKKNLNGINKNFKINFNNNNFYNKDLFFFQKKMQRYFNKYMYNEQKVSIKKYSFFYNFLPFKCELLTWKNTLKNLRILHILSIPYFYFKRILKINFQKNNLILPNKIGL